MAGQTNQSSLIVCVYVSSKAATIPSFDLLCAGAGGLAQRLRALPVLPGT